MSDVIQSDRQPYAPVDDELHRAFIDGWNARLDHADFDMALHFWMLSNITDIGAPTTTANVIKSDRDAAWAVRSGCYKGDDEALRRNWFRGIYDQVRGSRIPAFAAHRLASSADLRAKLDVAVEALEAIKYEADRENGGWFHLKRVIAIKAKKALATIGRD